jgi:hypothetical protein
MRSEQLREQMQEQMERSRNEQADALQKRAENLENLAEAS